MSLGLILTLIAHIFSSHGAHHVSFGAVSDHLGWDLTKNWVVKVCRVGSHGCSL